MGVFLKDCETFTEDWLSKGCARLKHTKHRNVTPQNESKNRIL